MQLAGTMLRMVRDRGALRYSLFIFFLSFSIIAFAQDNSPYSRYGLGNRFPSSNVISRSMGGVSAAFVDSFSINYNNPASYANFQSGRELRTKKMSYGRVILDVGVDITSRTLTTPNAPTSFTSSDLLFSHVYVGLPVQKNWSLTFGIRPLTRIGYNITRTELLKSPNTGLPIDTATTQFTGSGGSFLPTIGTGFAVGNLSLGVNMGYLFGKKQINTHRAIFGDSVTFYEPADYSSTTSFGGIFFNAGLQYKIDLNTAKTSVLRFGFSGNWKQTLNASQDIFRQTYTLNTTSGEELIVDSVYSQSGIPGQLIYPASYTGGFMFEKAAGDKTRGLSLGADYSQSKWSQYRFMGLQDSVQDSWEIHMGAQLSSISKPTRYSQAISYRFGLSFGSDYIKIVNSMPSFGISAGVGLPIINYNRLSPTQYSILNIGVEYGRRGNDSNPLKENMFRVSVGFDFTDLWFSKRKYE